MHIKYIKEQNADEASIYIQQQTSWVMKQPQVVPWEVEIGYHKKISSLKAWPSMTKSCPGKWWSHCPCQSPGDVRMWSSGMWLMVPLVGSGSWFLVMILEVFPNLTHRTQTEQEWNSFSMLSPYWTEIQSSLGVLGFPWSSLPSAARRMKPWVNLCNRTSPGNCGCSLTSVQKHILPFPQPNFTLLSLASPQHEIILPRYLVHGSIARFHCSYLLERKTRCLWVRENRNKSNNRYGVLRMDRVAEGIECTPLPQLTHDHSCILKSGPQIWCS